MDGRSREEQLVVKIQCIVRQQLARRRCRQLVKETYRKCNDAASDFVYYCNLRTGESSWQCPLHVDATDVDWMNTEKPRARTVNLSGKDFNDVQVTIPEMRVKQSKRFQIQCARYRDALIKQNQALLERVNSKWDRKVHSEMLQKRKDRLIKLKADNSQLAQAMPENTKRETVMSIREAAMRGDLTIVAELLRAGISANAQSAMGLTPLHAACQHGHSDIAALLLANGADIDHALITSGRTPLMEATSRGHAQVVKTLLRHGALLHLKDRAGEGAFNGISDPHVYRMMMLANQPWSLENAFLFPTEFRAATLSLAYVRRRQIESDNRHRVEACRDIREFKQKIPGHLKKFQVHLNNEMTRADSQSTLVKRANVQLAGYLKMEQDMKDMVVRIQQRVDSWLVASQCRSLTDAVIWNILSYCDRHWFDPRRLYDHDVISQKQRTLTNGNISMDIPVVPRDSVDRLPDSLEDEWTLSLATLEEHCKELERLEGEERYDTNSGISRTRDGKSTATLDVIVIRALNLPRRDPRTQDEIDPYVRLSIWMEGTTGSTLTQQSDPRWSDSNPVWEWSTQLVSIESSQASLVVQVLDEKRHELAGEVTIPLRRFLNQREHRDWYELPPTLKQQVFEKAPRTCPAQIELCLRFIHNKATLQSRRIQEVLTKRYALAQKRQTYLHTAIDRLISELP